MPLADKENITQVDEFLADAVSILVPNGTIQLVEVKRQQEEEEAFEKDDAFSNPSDTPVSVPVPVAAKLPVMSRKRSSSEFDDEEDTVAPGVQGTLAEEARNRTPPKKARIAAYTPTDLDASQSPTSDGKVVKTSAVDSLPIPRLSTKRSSEELEVDDDGSVPSSPTKRCKVMAITADAGDIPRPVAPMRRTGTGS